MTVMQQMRARPAKIRYIDLCEHEADNTQHFFGDCGLARIDVYGLAIEMNVEGIDCMKVLFYDGIEGDTSSQGIVIPISCVLSVTWFDDGEDQATVSDVEMN